ncbi:hypothetical protein [Embleya hyalina]|uniref:Uncharacterized protein n=1 Tax=Embleya hyalina TaxID=516124 RepID=A0A401Z3B9_9ACTN|nr:hypothetical protein [Embleya hyalina]GCE01296.1 hypothetical protein EHYA_09060 [Embleya hyalina]
MNDPRHDDVVIDRLRELAGRAESAATLAAPERVRTRGARRRTRLRVAGAGALTACVVAGALWATRPDDGAAVRGGPAASSPGDRAALTPPPADAERIGLGDPTYLPTVRGVEWTVEGDMVNRPDTAFPVRLFGPCAATPPEAALGGVQDRRVTAAGSRVKTFVTSTWATGLTPQAIDAEARRIYTSWQAVAAACMSRVPGGGPDTEVWSWSGDGRRGSVVLTRRGHVLGWVATEMTAADPAYPLTAEVGPALMDKAILTAPTPPR